MIAAEREHAESAQQVDVISGLHGRINIGLYHAGRRDQTR